MRTTHAGILRKPDTAVGIIAARFDLANRCFYQTTEFPTLFLWVNRELIQIARNEGRSLAQVCEILLRGGVWSYKDEGSRYLNRLLSRQKKTSSE
jgi:hypothetical protein